MLGITSQALGNVTHPKCFELTVKSSIGAASEHCRVRAEPCMARQDVATRLLGSQGLPLLHEATKHPEHEEHGTPERAG